MIIEQCEQNSPEWYEAKRGLPSASGFQKIVDSKGNRSKQRDKYMYELIGEVVTGESKDTYTNANMDRGHERENESRKTYEFINDVEVQQVGFCYFDEKKKFGCSPDGLIGDDGIFETKDAAANVHLERWEKGWAKSSHFQQIQGNLYVTGRTWVDLVSYSRGFKPLIIRFERDEGFIRLLKVEIKLLLDDMKTIIAKYSA